MIKDLKSDTCYRFESYTEDTKLYDECIGKIFYVTQDTRFYYMNHPLEQIGKNSLFADAAVFKELPKIEYPEYYL